MNKIYCDLCGKQMTLFDLGIADGFDCDKCAWRKYYGYCYPEVHLHRRYYYIDRHGTRCCSDYCTAFASVQ